MSAIHDYYGLLEVGERADAVEIKRAYHRLARRYHPDCNRGDPVAAERFKAVQEAYAVLSDPERRRLYDRLRHAPPDGNGLDVPFRNGHTNGFAAHGPATGLDDHAFADLFDRVGEGAPGPFARSFVGEPLRGKDVPVQVRLTFEQALRGGGTSVPLPNGERVPLTVPRGVRSGERVHLPGQGGPAPAADGPAGDLIVTYRVEPSARFRREGDDLHVVETVSALEAMLGGRRTLANAYGQKVTLPIPPGTQPGDRLRLRGQGVETASGKGDLYVEVQVAVPRELTEEQRETLARAARRCGLL